jgi:hypothetical protein
MEEEVGPDERLCDVGHDKSPHEIPAQSKVEAKGQPSVGEDGSAVSRAEVIIYSCPALRDEFTGVHTEARTRVHQESQLSDVGWLVGWLVGVQACAAPNV